MNVKFFKSSWKWLRLVGGIGLLVLAGITFRIWWPGVSKWVQTTISANRKISSEEHDHGAAEHHHDEHAHAHDEGSSLALSAAARGNLGLTPKFVRPVELQTYRRTINVPAVVVSRPGRTHIQVATPLTGVITHVHAVQGETVQPGSLLFEIRLTHEELVQLQTDFVKTLGELEVENREVVRLEEVAQSGAIAGKTLLERKYARDKLTALLGAQRGALKLHGLSEAQIDRIAKDGQLLRDLQIIAPSSDEHSMDEELRLAALPIAPAAFVQDATGHAPASNILLTMEELNAHKGQAVVAGEKLCALADYGRLYLQGIAFEQDARLITQAAERNWTATALFDDEAGQRTVDSLKIVFVANAVDPESRTLAFFVDLPNRVVRDFTNAEGQRYVSWEYRPGQRLQLSIPVEEWPNEIVLPVDAVAQEGAEYFVFQENGDHFDRVPIHVKYRDQSHVVVANDGSLFPGDVVALRGAHQMLIALKNTAGGGVDPHAGHNH